MPTSDMRSFEAPSAGPTQGVVAQFRQLVQAALPPTALLRFTDIAWLGEGGMGVVYSAYDATLERTVAIKVLSASGEDAEARCARLLREGQALAKLRHPNVVGIHDAQRDGGEVWLSMEYVDGVTLTTWLAASRRTWREVVPVVVCVARGLAAAHAAGLVHSDVKPGNVMIDRAGRVLVMDFGLVRTHALALTTADEGAAERTMEIEPAPASRVMAVQGTPGYMAPEQWRGAGTDGRTDQFSLCVLLWEALYGERPFAGTSAEALQANVCGGVMRPLPPRPRVPKWLRAAMLRGLAVPPGQRFASMEEFADALEFGGARVRNRWIRRGLVAAAVVAGVAGAGYEVDQSRRIAACEATGAEIADVWNDDARAAMQRSIRATGLSFAAATADRLPIWFAAQAEAWRAARTAACMHVDVEASWDADTLDRALWCLEDRRVEVEVLVDELSHADVAAVQKAILAAAHLRPIAACLDEDQLRRQLTPPAADRGTVGQLRRDLTRAYSLKFLGRYAEALALVQATRAAAEALPWVPLAANAQQLESALLSDHGNYPQARRLGAEAYFAAANVGAWDVAAAAAADVAYTLSQRLALPAEAREWLEHSRVAITHAGDPSGLRESARLSRLALVEHQEGHVDRGRDLNREAIARTKAMLGEAHPDVAALLSNLGADYQKLGDYERAEEVQTQALNFRMATQGPDHPDVAEILSNLGNTYRFTGALRESFALHRRALDILERALGADNIELAPTLNNLAVVAMARGDLELARATNERALAIKEKALGPDHPDVATSLNNLAGVYVEIGRLAEALPLMARATRIWEKVLGADHADVALSLSNQAVLQLSLGAFPAARELFIRAIAIREMKLGANHPDVAYSLVGLGESYLADGKPREALAPLLRAVAIYDALPGVQEAEIDADFDLAKALVETGGDRKRALVEAEKAREGLIQAGPGKADTLATVEAWIAKRRLR